MILDFCYLQLQNILVLIPQISDLRLCSTHLEPAVGYNMWLIIP